MKKFKLFTFLTILMVLFAVGILLLFKNINQDNNNDDLKKIELTMNNRCAEYIAAKTPQEAEKILQKSINFIDKPSTRAVKGIRYDYVKLLEMARLYLIYQELNARDKAEKLSLEMFQLFSKKSSTDNKDELKKFMDMYCLLVVKIDYKTKVNWFMDSRTRAQYISRGFKEFEK